MARKSKTVKVEKVILVSNLDIRLAEYPKQLVEALEEAYEMSWDINYSSEGNLRVDHPYDEHEVIYLPIVPTCWNNILELEQLVLFVQKAKGETAAEKAKGIIRKIALEKLTEEERKALGFK